MLTKSGKAKNNVSKCRMVETIAQQVIIQKLNQRIQYTNTLLGYETKNKKGNIYEGGQDLFES